ncbi:hypothetical protein FGO68_gene7656 [Halteria grandinella]|uniref:NAD-dependent epimerase/dehydratase domain-containing protein n=1 Tax=Halteria grandinella TaxID=5974 RepID=A0A8J8NNC9_HALGN|nr:hypothetical protein FGO68_gene7656 [Halteria grandinella]
MKIDILQIGQNKSPNKLMVESSKKKVVITGISGFMGSQVCAAFLRDGGFIVRGTVRDKTNEAKIGPLRKAFGTKFEELELFNADLLQPESLDAAIAGMDYVVHTASPLPFESPEDENVVIKPAVEGTLAVMRAAHKHKVKRVVMTSSAAAVAQKKPENQKELYDESDWSDLDVCPPYEKSKTMAEKAAWNYLDSIQGDRFELVTLNPCFIFGPSLIPGDFASGQMLGSILSGKYPGMPKISLAIVDVRDVALAHLQAIKVREAANQRIILSESTLWFKEIADILNEAFPEFQIKTNELGYCPVKVISWFDKKAARIITRWGLRNVYNNQKSKDILGIQYHSPEENVIAMARSLIENGVVEDKRVKK